MNICQMGNNFSPVTNDSEIIQEMAHFSEFHCAEIVLSNIVPGNKR